jgi:transposase
MALSIEECVFLVECVFREDNTYTDLVEEKFAEKFPETRLTHRNAVRRLDEKFRETYSVLDAKRSGRPSKLNDKKFMDISGQYRHSWTLLPIPFISEQRLFERTVLQRMTSRIYK